MNDEDKILFFWNVKTKESYYPEFTAFYMAKISLDGKEWPSTEQYFQGKKFEGTEIEEKIRNTQDPEEAKTMGQNRSYPLRKDWNEVRVDVMYKCTKAKFEQHEDLKNKLLETGSKTIVFHCPCQDKYWGDGGDGSGKNELGKILMRVREEIKK